MIKAIKRTSPDDFQTPAEALLPLYPHIKKKWVIWECASGRGNLTRAFRKNGYQVVSSDIKSGKNFLHFQPPHFDCIITNPPYSLKNEFLTRAYELKKPFAFLLPLTTLETDYRQKLFKKYGVEIISVNKRINFIPPDGNGSRSWFATAWFTRGLGIGKELTFY